MPTEVPPGVKPIFFTGGSQKIFNCIVDEQVTEDNRRILIPKQDILDDFLNRAAVSDFSPLKKEIQAYPDNESILLVYDPDFEYGENFFVCITVESRELILNPPKDAPGGVEDGDDQDGGDENGADEGFAGAVSSNIKVPRPYTSMGSEAEVDDMVVTSRRELLSIFLSQKRMHFGAKTNFTKVDGGKYYEEWTLTTNEEGVINRQENDAAVQAIADTKPASAQTFHGDPRNAGVQYESRHMDAKDQATEVESTAFSEFVSSVMGRFTNALHENLTVNIYKDEFKGLTEDEGTAHKRESVIKEYQSFTDLVHSKGRLITAIDWFPLSKGIIAVSCADKATFNERSKKASQAVTSESRILVWGFSDPIHPKLMLEAPSDVYTLKFNPDAPHIIAAGCMSGQVAIWDLSDKLDDLSGKQSKTTKGQLNIPLVRCMVASSIEHSHKTCVSDLHWLPSAYEIDDLGKPIPSTSEAQNQFVTVSTDGCVLFWDLRGHRVQGEFPPLADGLKSLDLVLTPCLKLTLARTDVTGEFGGTKLCLKDPPKSKMFKSFASLSDDEKANVIKNLRTKMVIGTEDGEIVHNDWSVVVDSNTNKAIPGHIDSVFKPHHGNINMIDVSPFFSDVFLVIGGWTFTIWKEGCDLGPLIVSPYQTSYICGGLWSPTRPGVFYIAKSDGTLDVWDLMDQSHAPSMTHKVSAVPLKSFIHRPHFPDVLDKSHFVALGDENGTLHIVDIPRSLTKVMVGEKESVEKFFSREVQRMEFTKKMESTRANQLNAWKDKEKNEQQREEDVESPSSNLDDGSRAKLHDEKMERELEAKCDAFFKYEKDALATIGMSPPVQVEVK